MKKLTIDQLDLAGKRVLMRVDFNVPLADGVVADDTRIRMALPSIKKVIDSGGKLILMSHLGRPKGERKPEFSLKPAAESLSDLLGKYVPIAPDCIGEETAEMVAKLNDGDVLMLENLRFHKAETDNDEAFSKELAEFADVYVNDAFGTAHRAHASTEGVTKFIDQCASGYLIEKELTYLGGALENPNRPFVAVLGGAKISGKIDVITSLLDKVDTLIIGGGMAYTFYKAMGLEIGKSLLEEDRIPMAKQIMADAEAKGTKLLLPIDCVVASEFSNDAEKAKVARDGIPADKEALDIGPETIKLFSDALLDAKTIVWNGPMGVFEFPNFAIGTNAIAKVLADCTDKGAATIIGGGDSASAIAKAGLSDKMSHISTGGGASLEFLEGKILPGVAALTDA